MCFQGKHITVAYISNVYVSVYGQRRGENEERLSAQVENNLHILHQTVQFYSLLKLLLLLTGEDTVGQRHFVGRAPNRLHYLMRESAMIHSFPSFSFYAE